MYRIVASDMDETFLSRDGSIPPVNIEAVRRMRELGCLFVPCSGRPYPSIVESLAPLPPELMEGSYVISFNGGCVNRYGEDEPLSVTGMDFEKADALYRYGRELGLGMHVYALNGTTWGTGIVPEEWAYLDGRLELVPFEGDDLSPLRDVPLAKILYIKPDGNAYLHKVAATMPPQLLDGVDTTYSSGRYLEFLPKGVSKGAGLAKLASLLGVDLADTVGCGDAENDLPLIKAAGVGVAVSNALGSLPQHADYVTTASCDEGIMPEVVERFVEPAART